MTLKDLGYNRNLAAYREENNLDSFDIGRIISEHKDRYTVKTDKVDFDSELIGNLRFTAASRYDLPAVGDWVAISEYDKGKALIHAVFPRHSIIERQAVGKSGQIQIIATNVDYGLIVQSVNRDFSINRLERYLTICNASNVIPVVVLSKIDLINDLKLEKLVKQVEKRIKDVPVIAISNKSSIGVDKLSTIIKKGKTYCLLGSSGVGKSTLLNKLYGKNVMNTEAISRNIDRGKHITSHRELFILQNGGIMIDNPGMREVGISDASSGLKITFDMILELSGNCKFNDCKHINEKGCAVLDALENGAIDVDSYENFQKMERERQHFESSIEEKRQKDKDFGKMIKNVKKQRKHDKY